MAINYPTTYMISSQVYRDTYNQYDQCYKNIITINLIPKGPLTHFVRRIQMPYLSPFQYGNNCGTSNGCGNRGLGMNNCALALISLRNSFCNGGGGVGGGVGVAGGLQVGNKYSGELMCDDEIPDLFSFLLSNGYKIDTSLTKMMNTSEVRLNNSKIIAFITYAS